MIVSRRVRVPFTGPLCPDSLFGHLAATAVPGVEEWHDGAYRRTLALPGGPAVVALAPRPDHVDCRLALSAAADEPRAIELCRWILDLDAEPAVIDGALRSDPHLAPLVAQAPGRRVPRTAGPEEMAVRAVLGQQVSTAAARTHAARLVRAHGTALADPQGGLTHLFPEPAQLAGLDPATLALPQARRRTLLALVEALAAGHVRLDPAGDLAAIRARLAQLPGIGPWTLETIAMRGLGDPDAFPGGDLGVVAAARRLGLPSAPAALARAAEAWRPWRAYAVQHLWATGEHAVNRLPD